MSYLDELNKEQYSAATTVDGPLMIIAGAGTGKTHTLVARTMYMIEQGIKPDTILLLTFTNKAAKEMKERIVASIGDAGNTITACTFHSFCATLMRKYAFQIGYNPNFSILDNSDSNDAISICRQEYLDKCKKEGVFYNKKEFPTSKTIQNIYEGATNNCTTYKEIILQNYEIISYMKDIITILNDYKNYKRKHNFLDYNDLLYYFNFILTKREGVRKSLDEQYKYIMCDEYQDTNIIQDSILDKLSKDYNNLAVVGDDNQSIYAFRGAHIENILTFQKRHKGCQVVTLKENYRSSQEILDLANNIMKHATEGIDKNLHGQFSDIKPCLYNVYNSYIQTDAIINSIKEYRQQGYSYKDMAIICRSSVQTYQLEAELNKNLIPYEKFGGVKFFEKAAIKDVLAFIRVITNSRDELAWFRLLQLYPGIGKGYANKIAKLIVTDSLEALNTMYTKAAFSVYLKELYKMINKYYQMDFQDQICDIIQYYRSCRVRLVEKSNKDDNKIAEDYSKITTDMKDVETLLILSKSYKNSRDFISDIVLDSSSPDKNGDYVNITTIHSAKGLEYEVVFMPDIIEGITPMCKPNSLEDPEELRCFYVALTRAKKKLHLYFTKKSTSMHKPIEGKLSHFIDYEDVIKCFQQKSFNDYTSRFVA